MTNTVAELIQEGDFVAKVSVDLIADDGAWGPYFSHDDAKKLSRVARALRAGDIEAAKREAEVFELTSA